MRRCIPNGPSCTRVFHFEREDSQPMTGSNGETEGLAKQRGWGGVLWNSWFGGLYPSKWPKPGMFYGHQRSKQMLFIGLELQGTDLRLPVCIRACMQRF